MFTGKIFYSDFKAGNENTGGEILNFQNFLRRLLNFYIGVKYGLDLEGKLSGIITLRDLRVLLSKSVQISTATRTAALMSWDVVTVRDDEDMEKAFQIFAANEFSFLPVVSGHDPCHVVGYLKKSDLIAAYDQHILKEDILEPLSWVCPLPTRDKKR